MINILYNSKYNWMGFYFFWSSFLQSKRPWAYRKAFPVWNSVLITSTLKKWDEQMDSQLNEIIKSLNITDNAFFSVIKINCTPRLSYRHRIVKSIQAII